MHQTVNLTASAFVGSNPTSSTKVREHWCFDVRYTNKKTVNKFYKEFIIPFREMWKTSKVGYYISVQPSHSDGDKFSLKLSILGLSIKEVNLIKEWGDLPLSLWATELYNSICEWWEQRIK